ncbi:AAA domain-containing protein [Aliivibrio fischeri]|uniref:McrB family protein n=1 Tax=Aliivibrio fischeri TaxID=668 RepID=UPI0012DA5C37|nr:AAA family ATPase [Aliivibrio fischeri]MUJ27463.1 AAA domain-containing protein [Aliivibrio fischeri]
MNQVELQSLWDSFITRWPREKLAEMTLKEYVSVNDPDTFTYWLETKTGALGSIKGNTSAKFGIYKRGGEGKEQSGIGHGDIYTWRTRYGNNEETVFTYVKNIIVTIAKAAYKGDLQVIEELDFAPLVKWKIAFLYQDQQQPTIVNIFSKNMLIQLSSLSNNSTYAELYAAILKKYNSDKFENIAEFGRASWSSLDNASSKISDLLAVYEPSQATLEPFFTASNENTMSPLNQILYGPPGTGKTYHTMESAVKAAEPTFTWTNRDELKAEYVRLVGDKRIRFVTFHQSYGYEEFVEGLSAKTEGNQIAYYEKDGIFKTISEDADKYRVTKTVESDRDFDSLWAKFLTELSQNENGIRVNTIRTFFIVTDVDNNTIRFEKDKGDSTHSLSVKTLKAVFNDEREIKGGLNPYYSSLIKHLSAYSNQTDTVHIDRKNFVLVIDEINRGNISKIFGELITLIEPSKRKGAEEEIELVLPYSGDTFSVPDNLHIIGTMNTADRSLAMMDTALRRRFDFIEMMPKPELFNNKQIKGIDLTRLLNALNKRIEALYDREHTLGHAFLFPAYNEQDEDKAFELLKAAFKNKIIPLLEEYFYDDWNKIRLVLGDNQKSDELRFVKVHNEYYDSLFGSEHGLETYEESKTRYTLMSFNGENSVWDNPQAYIAVYASIK